MGILSALSGGPQPTDIYQLPTFPRVYDENDGTSFVFARDFGVAVDVEIENRDTSNPLTYKADSRDAREETAGVGVTRNRSRMVTRAIYITSANPNFIIRAALVNMDQARKIVKPGVGV